MDLDERERAGPSPAPRPQRKTGDEGRKGGKEREISVRRRKGSPRRDLLPGGFDQAYIGGFDSAGPVRVKESNKRRREAKDGEWRRRRRRRESRKERTRRVRLFDRSLGSAQPLWFSRPALSPVVSPKPSSSLARLVS